VELIDTVMNGNQMTSTWRQHTIRGIMIMIISIMAGCTLFNKPPGNNTLPPPSPSRSDNGPFAYALSIYQKGDYIQAAKLFNALSRPNTGDDLYLKAQLGEVCCRLMLSTSPEDLSTANRMWKDLMNSNTGDIWRVEQTLFDPLIDRLSVSTDEPSPAAMAPDPPKKQNKTELTALKKKSAQITQLQRQLDAVMAENQILKQKIKALEAIDQNIQKKKTEMAAPSE
jgi:hypothetical protein